MADAPRLLVVFHSRSGGTAAMTDAVVAGANDDAIEGVDVRVQQAFDTTVDDVRACNAIVLGTPENFGYMSGAIKDFFERVYYPLLDETPGPPVRAVREGEHRRRRRGAQRRAHRRRPALEARGAAGRRGRRPRRPTTSSSCQELGATVAAGLEAGMF